MTARVSYDLLVEPWIPVLTAEGEARTFSLREVFERAHEIRAIVCDLPTVTFAVNRLLVAVLYRTFQTPRPVEAWEMLWRQGHFDSAVQDYLTDYADRFDLFHQSAPFLQVAGLNTAKGELGGLEKLVGDVPNGHQYFCTRAGDGLAELSFSEAALWLIHVQAFDPSGIKSGAAGDPRVKGGKGYPIGTGWAGNLGGVLIEGDNLFQTLLLNLALGRPDRSDGPWSSDLDLAVWERPPLGPEEEAPSGKGEGIVGRIVRGPVDLLTWPSRRVRLDHDGQSVIGVLIANGDPLGPQNRHLFEPMTGWRYSEPQSKKFKDTIYMPRTHDQERSLWRGLGSFLPQAGDPKSTASGDTGRPAGNLAWVQLMVGRVLPAGALIRTRAIGITYGPQSSTIAEVYDDSLTVHAALLNTASLQQTALLAVASADLAVQAVGKLARDLAAAAGGDGITQASTQREYAFQALDSPYRQWLVELTAESDPVAAIQSWCSTARQLMRRQADTLISAAGPAAWAGRDDARGNHIDVGLADRRFNFNLAAALPLARQEQARVPEEATA